MERVDRFLHRLGLERNGRSPTETKSKFPTGKSLSSALIMEDGDAFLREFNGRKQRRIVEIVEVFIQRDEEGLQRLIETYGVTTAEGIARALDAYATAPGAESSYAKWFGEVVE